MTQHPTHPFEQPVTLPDICLQRITSLLASGHRKILGIVAPPGAGKSTLAQRLLDQYGGAVQVVPMDGFHLANSELERLGKRSRKGAPDTFDAWGYQGLLRRIKDQAADEVVYAPDFRREIEEAIAGALPVLPDTPLIVTEGNYLLLGDSPWPQVRQALDEIWYLDVPDALRHERLLARHMHFGRSRQQALDWMASTDTPNAVRIAQTRQHADVCVPWV
ncbi:MAG: nucleoside/nucleotide kinase family protein [Comamonadaceae bacterium]|nr:nucleoside/nucleotide kinase family protein [Comamonadaceae bacterium]